MRHSFRPPFPQFSQQKGHGAACAAQWETKTQRMAETSRTSSPKAVNLEREDSGGAYLFNGWLAHIISKLQAYSDEKPKKTNRVCDGLVLFPWPSIPLSGYVPNRVRIYPSSQNSLESWSTYSYVQGPE